MDGVLCDFGAAIRKATGKSKEAWMRIDGRVKWDTVIDTPKFWENIAADSNSNSTSDEFLLEFCRNSRNSAGT